MSIGRLRNLLLWQNGQGVVKYGPERCGVNFIKKHNMIPQASLAWPRMHTLTTGEQTPLQQTIYTKTAGKHKRRDATTYLLIVYKIGT